MDLENFDYDLKNEFAPCRIVAKDNIHQFLRYKLLAGEQNFDCDRCDYMKNVYSQLWGYNDSLSGNYQQISVGNRKITMGPDTMNSFFTTFTWALNRWCIKDIKKELGIECVSLNHIRTLYDNYDVLKAIMEKNFSKKAMDNFMLFAQLTHTIGNMVLVPRNVAPYTGKNTFNMERSSKWNDYFDLSLIWLYNNDEEDWTKETFLAYKEQFFLFDYIGTNGRVMPLIKAHKSILKGNFDEDGRPQTKKELIELLDNIINRITYRGKMMRAKLIGDEITFESMLADLKRKRRPSVNIAVSRNNKKKREKLQDKVIYSNDAVKCRNANKVFWQSFLISFGWMIAFFPVILAIGLSLCGMNWFLMLLVVIAIPIGYIVVAKRIATRRKNIYWLAPNRMRGSKGIHIKSVDVPKRGMIRVAIIEVIVGTIICIVSSRQGTPLDFESFLFYYLLVSAFMFPWFVYFVRYGVKTKCHHCKCFYTIKRVSRNAIAKEDVLVKSEEEVLTEGIDYDTGEVREVITYQEQMVPGTRVTYVEIYKCKWCNATFSARYSIDY